MTRYRRFILLLVLGGVLGLAAYVAAGVLLVTPESRLLASSRTMMEAKLARLEQPQRPPHLIVISGSNALYSIDSTVLSESVGRPVTNAAMQWNYAFLMMEAAAERVVPGDWVLLPLEWAFYEDLTRRSPLEACYLIAQARERLSGLSDWIRALHDCNPRTLLLGMRQRLTRMAGFDFNIPPASDVVSPEGDILENIPAAATFAAQSRAAAAGRGLLAPAVIPATTPDFDQADAFDVSYQRLGAIIARLRARGAEVLVSYPVTVGMPGSGHRPPFATESWLARHRDWVTRQGGRVVSTPDAHAFMPDCFFDTQHHLHRGCNGENARRYARAILQDRASRP